MLATRPGRGCRHDKTSQRKGTHMIIISDLTGFSLSRLDEDERDGHLFHELTCPTQEQQARDGLPASRCRCPLPAQTLTRVQVTRDIIADCGRQLNRTGSRAPGMLPAAEQVPRILGALALAYQQHPRWQEQ
jgi:hypothetical protein